MNQKLVFEGVDLLHGFLFIENFSANNTDKLCGFIVSYLDHKLNDW